MDAIIEIYEDDTIGAVETAGTDTIELFIQGAATVVDVPTVDFLEFDDGRGPAGKSAYQLFKDAGFVGTEADWRASLAGSPGGPGSSAYQIALNNGFVGSQAAWLTSLKGDPGLSAYQIAVAGGYSGSSAAWLASLQGSPGAPGLSAYQVAVAGGYGGSQAAWLASLQGSPGAPGDSAYAVAVANGFVGTQAAWLASLKGADGVSPTVTTPVGLAQPAIGYGVEPPMILSTATGAQTGAMFNAVRFMPFDVGPKALTFDAAQQWVSVAEAGGAGIVNTVGVYATDADGSMPNVNGGLLTSCTLPAFTTTGARLGTFASPLTLQPGRYWIAIHKTWTTVPTTFATVYMINNSLRMPVAVGSQSSGIRYYTLNTQTSLPNALTNPAWLYIGDSLTAHTVLRRSA